jgi:hypothetical protein
MSIKRNRLSPTTVLAVKENDNENKNKHMIEAINDEEVLVTCDDEFVKS